MSEWSIISQSSPKTLDGMPKIKKAPELIYVGQFFWWDYRRDWKSLVDLAKRVGAKFDGDLKKWKLKSPEQQYALVKLIQATKEPEDNIRFFDFETDDVVPVRVWKSRILERAETVKEVISRKMVAPTVVFGPVVRAKFMLRPSGRPIKREDLLLWGLVVHGCSASLDEANYYNLMAYKREATDFIVNNFGGNVEVSGIPQLMPTALLCDLYSDDELFPHQKKGINFLYGRERALLADDMGLGKTMQSILAAEQLKSEGEVETLFIVCPVSLQLNWWKELAKWQSSFTKINIIPYSVIHKLAPEDIPEKSLIILDESHYLKNPTSRRTQAVITLVDAAKKNIKRLWMLTGTPVTKDNRDLWSTAMLLGHPLKKLSPLALGAMRGDDNAVLSGAMKTLMLMRKKADCLNLPPKLRQTVDVEVASHAEIDVSVLKGRNEKAIMEHLMRLKRWSAEAKVPHAIEFIDEIVAGGNKVVVFSDHTAPLQALSAHYGASSVLLDGQTKLEDRQSNVDRFQSDPECMVFLGNIQAAGVGITLTAATYVVFVDLTWLPANVHQAEDRCHRIGQKGTVNVYYIVDPKLITDRIILRILGDRSGEIASFEGAKQTILAEIQAWIDERDK